MAGYRCAKCGKAATDLLSHCDLPALRAAVPCHLSPPGARFSAVPSALSEPLDDRRDALAEPDAHRLQPVALARPLQLVQERGHQLAARAPERMSQRDRTAADA